jgi:pyruvate ferredoxin oxidoreductase gamma subunit
MFRIRFHGRGGQGMKTASRIVGSAAFRQGFYAQDSPVYGAERRGAPMIAFTRFDSHPILERGVVTSPDLVVVADASLLSDPLVKPLYGLASTGAVLINASGSPDLPPVPEKHVHDFTESALRHVGSASALSVALGAAAARLAGLESQFVEQALLEELRQLKLDDRRIEKNLTLARACFDEVQPRPKAGSQSEAAREPIRLVTPVYEGPWAGTASVATSPNTALRKTGDWRVMRPLIDAERCTHCWICFVNCPDGAVALDSSALPQIDYGVCKGCLICAEECPVDAITTTREAHYDA